MASTLPEAVPEHLPAFITEPGQTDWLLMVMAIVLVLAVLGVGVFFFWLHSLPERMVHHKVQFDLVAVLALLSLFTHIHAFWVAALILAVIDLPNIPISDYFDTMRRMAASLEKIADTQPQAKPVAAIPAEAGGETRPQTPSVSADVATSSTPAERAPKRERNYV